jgi:hypothetical protein
MGVRATNNGGPERAEDTRRPSAVGAVAGAASAHRAYPTSCPPYWAFIATSHLCAAFEGDHRPAPFGCPGLVAYGSRSPAVGIPI